MQIVFFVLQKKYRNKLCVSKQDTHFFLLRTFFSKVNNNNFFLAAPLIVLIRRYKEFVEFYSNNIRTYTRIVAAVGDYIDYQH